MGTASHDSEKRATEDRQHLREALADPQNFYPRPEDVVADPRLSRQDKLTLLDNWQVMLEDKAGALGKPHGPTVPNGDKRAMLAAIAEARARLAPPS